MDFMTIISSPLGNLLLRSDGLALTGLEFTEGPGKTASALPLFKAVEAWLQVYFEGRDPGPVPVPLKPAGTAFQQQVWKLLLEIPYGESRSYGALARMLGREAMSAQAVGGAVGKNPIAIVIPCHRVLGAKGQLTGYAWGLSRKKQLLELEGISYR